MVLKNSFKVFDLHIDLSSFCLTNNRLDISYCGKLGNGFFPDQVDLPRLAKGNVKLFLGNICPITATPIRFKKPKDSLTEVMKQLAFYIDRIKEFNKKGIKILISIEGAYFIEKERDLSIMPFLKKLGVVSIAPTWNFSNSLGSGANDFNAKSGLTKLGKKFIKICEKNGIFIDAVHASKKTFWDIVKFSKRPVFVSHTASYDLRQHRRNLDRQQIKAIVKSGGIIGVCFIKDFIGNPSIRTVVKHLRYIAETAGLNNIAIGSDFDGMSKDDLIPGLEDVSKLQKLLDACLKAGFIENDLEKIAWKNAARFFDIK